MPERVFTVEEILRMMQIVKKEMQYLETLREKWEAQKTRFPLIYEGILKQQEALRLRAGKLRQMKVVVETADLEELPTQLLEDTTTPAATKDENLAEPQSAKPEPSKTEASPESETISSQSPVEEGGNTAAVEAKATKSRPRRRLNIRT
ncbi:MAG: hypothetical protein DRP82_01805 [Planctomycetota bacterium]|nr:MAG: hypothetical protein DRP82_01805 [Planctomycetota bacterium]